MPALAAAAVVLTGCGLAQSVHEHYDGHVKSVGYGTGIEGKHNSDARLPSWVPDQARDAQEVIRTTGAERILRFTADDPGWLSACRPAPASTVPATLTASWWPAGQETRTDRTCDGWHIRTEGPAVYAYRPESRPQPPN